MGVLYQRNRMNSYFDLHSKGVRKLRDSREEDGAPVSGEIKNVPP